MRVAVIGAGLAGIAAARRMVERGVLVIVFEKSRGFGGRCASKRWEGQILDHGAQYFALRDEGFREAVTRACGEKLLKIAAPVLNGQGEEFRGGPRYYHAEGNSRLVRDLATGLEVRTGKVLEKIEAEGQGWRIEGEFFDRVISTAPLPQTRKLAGLEPGPSEYVPCLTLLLLYQGERPERTRQVYAFSDADDEEVIWTACENAKAGRVEHGKTALVVQASAAFSWARFEDNPQEWAVPLRKVAEEKWGLPSSAFLALHPHRWRYARVKAPWSAPELPPGWVFAGDALLESRVESAWLAGRKVAEEMAI